MKQQHKLSQVEQSTQITDPMGQSRTTLTRTQKSTLRGLQFNDLHKHNKTEIDDQIISNNVILITKRTSQTRQNKSSNIQRHRKMLQRLSDNFNVYKAPETLITNPDVLKVKRKDFKYSKEMIICYINDIQAIQDSIPQIDNPYDKQIIQYLQEARQGIESLMRRINSLLLHKNNREKCEQEMKDILLESFRQKNIYVQQRISYLFGKMEKLFYNPIQGAFYFKICKRLSDTNQYYRQKMKAYRGLGECLMRIRPQLSKLYLTKYLMASWKLNEKNDELLAYELLGKYYYYMGQIDKAKMYHDKMINGHGEEIDSRVRILAQSRLEQGSVGNQINKDHMMNDIDYVSSDDECYEIVLQPQLQLMNQPKPSKFFLKKIPEKKIVYEEANNNIRQKTKRFNTQSGTEFNIKNLQISSPHLSIGNVKDKVLLSHLTPNRKLEMYQYLCLASDKNGNQNSYQITGLYDKYESTKMLKYISNLVILFRNTLQWINSYNKSNSQLNSNRRKGYVIS